MNITKHNLFNLRKDIISKQMFAKTELIRIVKNKNNEVFVDRSKTAHGRGIYFIPTLANLEFIEQKNLLAKALRTKIEQTIYQTIRDEISEVWINGETKNT